MLPQMIGYVKIFEINKAISFKINDNKLLKKYTQIWKKVKRLLSINLVVSQFMVIMINTSRQK